MRVRGASLVIFVLVFGTVMSLAHAQVSDPLATLLFNPSDHSDARQFIYGEIGGFGNKHPLVHRLEFTQQNVTIILRNESNSDAKVAFELYVLNKYGLIVWHKTIVWLVNKLKAGESYAETWGFDPSSPVGTGFSALSDYTPAYVVLTEE